MKKRIFLFSLSSLTLMLAFSCDPQPNPEFVHIIFELPLRITPAKDTVVIGDTLWLEADFPDTVRDHRSGNYYYVPPSFDFRTSIGFRKLISPNATIVEQPGFAGAFAIHNGQGKIENLGQTFGSLKFAHLNNRYVVHIGIVPKQRGVATINFGTRWLAGGVYEKNADLSFIDLGKAGKAKRKAVLKNIYHVINQGDTTKNHFDLFKKHAIAGSSILATEENIYEEQSTMFTFVVK